MEMYARPRNVQPILVLAILLIGIFVLIGTRQNATGMARAPEPALRQILPMLAQTEGAEIDNNMKYMNSKTNSSAKVSPRSGFLINLL